MSVKVTVIMPSLNVAKYIRPCMESVLAQTLQDMEILAIDAGSTDGTLEILEEFAERDGRVRIARSDRKSYGYQMNLGISMATGDYVGVVETDDLIEPDMFETLYTIAISSRTDYVKGIGESFFRITPEVEMRQPIMAFAQNEFGPDGKIEIIPKEMPEIVLRDYYLWTGLYRKTFLEGIRFNETPGAAYQDIGFLLQTYVKAEKAVYVNKVVYHYRKDNPNASGYNHKAFHYLVEEYQYVDRLLEGMARKWYKVSFSKLFGQTNYRFLTMAAMGSFWEDAAQDIQILTARLKGAVKDRFLIEEDLSPDSWNNLKKMIEDPIALYQGYTEQFEQKRKNILELQENLQKGQTVLFGSGKWGKFAHALLVYYGVETIKAYCDNGAECQGKFLQGLPIMSPADVLDQYPDARFVITNKKNAQEMEEQLLAFGVRKERIFNYTAGADRLLFVGK